MSETVEVSVEKLVYGGDGLGRVDGRAVFVAGAAPGDRVLARVVESKKNFLRAEIVEVLEPGPARREPPCPFALACGGCQFQHVEYAAQVEAKAQFVRDAIERIGKLSVPGDVAVRADPEHELGYRVRATAHVARTREGVVFGFHAHRSHRVVDIPHCPKLVPELDEAWRLARASRDDLHRVDELELAAGDSGAAASPPVAAVGGATLRTTVEGATYAFTPASFFQANRFLLGDLVRGATAEAGEGDVAVDLFAGVGLFSIPLARRFRRVVAVEGDAQSAALARENAGANGAANVEVVSEPVERWLGRAIPGEADLVLLDPPRAGLGADGARALARLAPRRIVYVSCDPTTLARDLRALVDSGYALDAVEAFDLFPQTFHVETIAKLSHTTQ